MTLSLRKVRMACKEDPMQEAKDGAAQGIRTLDLRITNALLYQLS